MAKLAVSIALVGLLMLAAASPSSAGCVCKGKDTRGSWCAKSCYACFSNHAAPAGYCSYWLQKRKHRGTRDAHPQRGS